MKSLDFSKLKTLGSIYGDSPTPPEPDPNSSRPVSLDLIDEDPDQPRKEFDQAELEELAETIRENGVLQPILLRKTLGDRYILVIGARRFRAARLAGLREVQALLRSGPAGDLRSIQMIENIHRSALRPDEIAAYIERELAAGKSKSAIAKALKKSKSFVSLYCKFLGMPPCVRRLYDACFITDMKAIEDLVRAYEQNPTAIEAFCGAIREPLTRSLIDAYLARQQKPNAGPTVSEYVDEPHKAESTASVFENLPSHISDDEALLRTHAALTFGEGDQEGGGDTDATDDKPRTKKWAVLVEVGRDRGRLTLTGLNVPQSDHVMIAFEDGDVRAVPAGRVKLIGSALR